MIIIKLNLEGAKFNSDPVHGTQKEKFAKLISGKIIKPSK